jgi:allantoate deiminase
MDRVHAVADQVVARCRALASRSEVQGNITRTFLSDAMRLAYDDVRRWMENAGMHVRFDNAGNLRGCYAGAKPGWPPLLIGSHLDTVPNAGAFDGPLGVLLGVGLAELLSGHPKIPIELIGFSEEEGVRFGVPFIGSRALIGDLDQDTLARRDAQGISIADAIRNFALDPSRLDDALASDASGYLEFHIEQGPVLDGLDFPLAVVESIVGQSRAEAHFIGHANHAGTTPMHLRRDALAGAAEWIAAVEREASAIPDLVATIGRIEVKPCAGNVIPGWVRLSLDVRHPNDSLRHENRERFLQCGAQIAARRNLQFSSDLLLDQPAVKLDIAMTDALARAVGRCGYPVHRMHSGAGHDAMIVARRVPSAMLFLRSPGGISHHPDESVRVEDVAAALATGLRFVKELENG